MIYLQLFFNFLLIGALSFGGGYGTLSLIEDLAVHKYGWISPEQLYDVVTLSEITPGPIALNAASFTGYTAGGVLGAVLSTLGCIAVPCAFMAVLTYVYKKYRSADGVAHVMAVIKAAVCSLVFAAFLTLFLPNVLGIASVADIGAVKVNFAAAVIFAGAFVLNRLKKLSPIVIILLCGVFGGIFL